MRYKVFREQLLDETGNKYTAYGIRAVEKGQEMVRVSDIGCTYIQVRKLCMQCNRLRLSPMHLRDVAEDFAVKL